MEDLRCAIGYSQMAMDGTAEGTSEWATRASNLTVLLGNRFHETGKLDGPINILEKTAQLNINSTLSDHWLANLGTCLRNRFDMTGTKDSDHDRAGLRCCAFEASQAALRLTPHTPTLLLSADSRLIFDPQHFESPYSHII